MSPPTRTQLPHSAAVGGGRQPVPRPPARPPAAGVSAAGLGKSGGPRVKSGVWAGPGGGLRFGGRVLGLSGSAPPQERRGTPQPAWPPGGLHCRCEALLSLSLLSPPWPASGPQGSLESCAGKSRPSLPLALMPAPRPPASAAKPGRADLGARPGPFCPRARAPQSAHRCCRVQRRARPGGPWGHSGQEAVLLG